MAAVEHEHHEWIQEIMAANRDLAQRMAQLGIQSEYDDTEDILFVTIGPPAEAYTETVGNAIGLRVDPTTLKLVGLEILHAQSVAVGLVIGAAILAIAMLIVSWKSRQTPEPVPAQLYENLAAKVYELAAAA
jgi:hypothetical protein